MYKGVSKPCNKPVGLNRGGKNEPDTSHSSRSNHRIRARAYVSANRSGCRLSLILRIMKTPILSGGIPQDNIIFAFIFLAFVIFITVKGELRTYMGFFVPGNATGPPPVNSNQMVIPSPISGVPGLSSNPFQGLPSSLQEFLYPFGQGH